MNWRKYLPIHDLEYITYRHYWSGGEIIFQCSKCKEIRYYSVDFAKIMYPEYLTILCPGRWEEQTPTSWKGAFWFHDDDEDEPS